MDRPVVGGRRFHVGHGGGAVGEAGRLGVPLSIVHTCLLVPARVPDPIAVRRSP